MKKKLLTLENAKACPFCGGKAFEITSEESFRNLAWEYGSACVAITCGNHKCRAEICSFTKYNPVTHDYSGDDNYEERIDRLIRKWNTRKKAQ